MENLQEIGKNIEGVQKRVCGFSNEELAEAVVALSTILEETVDAVFLAHEDHKFLTQEYIDSLITAQTMARIIGETAAIQVKCDS